MVICLAYLDDYVNRKCPYIAQLIRDQQWVLRTKKPCMTTPKTTFEKYVAALTSASAVANSQLITSDVALRRCADALEWQAVITECANHLTLDMQNIAEEIPQQMDYLVFKGKCGIPPIGNPLALLTLFGRAGDILLGIQKQQVELGQDLRVLLESVVRIEQAVANLAQLNDQAIEACAQINAQRFNMHERRQYE